MSPGILNDVRSFDYTYCPFVYFWEIDKLPLYEEITAAITFLYITLYKSYEFIYLSWSLGFIFFTNYIHWRDTLAQILKFVFSQSFRNFLGQFIEDSLFKY